MGGCSQAYCGRLGIPISACLLSGPVVARPWLALLCAGGASEDRRNLWSEARQGRWAAAPKDELEASVCRQLCRGDITLRDAQAIFLEPDWTKAYLRYFGTR